MRVVVVGAGQQGVCSAWALASAGLEVVLVDVSADAARLGAARIRALVPSAVVVDAAADVRTPGSLKTSLSGAAAVLSCAPYAFNAFVADAAIEAKAHYVDLGGNTAVSRSILAKGDAARSVGVSLIPDCGLAPGLGTTLTMALLGRHPAGKHVDVLCGGLPVRPLPPLGYHLVFSLAGLLNEYSGTAEVITDGAVQEVSTLDPPRSHHVPELGSLESCRTSGGVGTACETLAGRLRHFEYRTLRWPGHWNKVRAWSEAGLLALDPVDIRGSQVVPREVLAALLAPRLVPPPGAKDLVVMVAEMPGTATFRLLDYGDDTTGFTAMERCTAIPAVIVTLLATRGRTKIGGVPLELAVDAEEFLAEFSNWPLDLRYDA